MASRLLRLVSDLEARHEERKQALSGVPIAIAWCESELISEAVELGPGEHIAADHHIVEPESDLPARWRTVERISTTPGDLGWIYDAAGQRVGEVVSDRGGLVEFKLWEHSTITPAIAQAPKVRRASRGAKRAASQEQTGTPQATDEG
ncbi:MAG TPA: hypothetical protein VKU01_23955 [Bryobacteraceae bacterium]|nr:hypothetical protein [Bryobacteraceae bacterium]